jgi:hypothetical protein
MPFILGSASGHLVLLIHAAMRWFVHEIFDYPSSLISNRLNQDQTCLRSRLWCAGVSEGVGVIRAPEVDNLRVVGLRPTRRVSLLRTATINISICPVY